MFQRNVILSVISFLGVLILGTSSIALASSIERQPATDRVFSGVNPYNPSKYGIPASLAGYKVIAVIAEDNTSCLASGEKRLILQTTDTSIDDFLKASSLSEK